MSSYDVVLKKLLLEERKVRKNGGFVLSLYVDTRNFNTSNFRTIVNSWLRKGFDQNSTLKGNSRLKKYVLEKVAKKYDNLREWGSGLGVFISFSELNKPVRSWIVHFYHTPKDEIFVGNTFDLDQLFWMQSLFSRTLVLNLHFKTIDAFVLNGLMWNKISTLDNISFDDSPSRFVGVFSSMKGRGGGCLR